MKIHAAHLTGPADVVALKVPRVEPETPPGVDPSEPRNDLPGWDEWNPDDGPFTVLHPDWVAAAQPCPQCEGDGMFPDDYTGDPYAKCPEPDCIDGKPKVELVYPCLCGCHTSTDPDVREDSYLCDECDGGGRVSAGVGTLELVPVYGGDPEPVPKGVHAWVFIHVAAWQGSHLHRIVDSETITRPITLPPGVKPGDTVAIWTAEETTP